MLRMLPDCQDILSGNVIDPIITKLCIWCLCQLFPFHYTLKWCLSPSVVKFVKLSWTLASMTVSLRRHLNRWGPTRTSDTRQLSGAHQLEATLREYPCTCQLLEQLLVHESTDLQIVGVLSTGWGEPGHPLSCLWKQIACCRFLQWKIDVNLFRKEWQTYEWINCQEFHEQPTESWVDCYINKGYVTNKYQMNTMNNKHFLTCRWHLHTTQNVSN